MAYWAVTTSSLAAKCSPNSNNILNDEIHDGPQGRPYMNRIGTSCALMIAICLGSGAAQADDPIGLYLGAGVGESQVRHDTDDLYNDPYFAGQHLAWKAIVGIRPIPPVGAELEYIDFGDPSGGPNYSFASANSEAKAAALFGVGYLPLPVPFLDLYGKLGVARMHSESTEVTPGICPRGLFCPAQYLDIAIYRQDRWSTDLAYGAGAQARFGAFAVRAEYERIIANTGDPDIYSLAVTWTF
jgi:opacity protein-like surface antigen